jgi:hypothetical protein
MPLRRLTPLLAPLVATLWAPSVQAFERQWHVGATGSVVFPNDSRARGYGAGVYGSYGISDVFDVRAELKSSFHEQLTKRDAFTIHSGALGLCYKVDILEWIPYIGVRAGYFEQAGGLEYRKDAWGVERPFLRWSRRGGFVGGFAGFDHAFSRSFAAGVEVATDQLLPDGLLSSLSLHAEYRWGY